METQTWNSIKQKKDESAFTISILIFAVFLLASCGGHMVSSSPMATDSAKEAGTIYHDQNQLEPWQQRVNPFSSSTAPENQMDDSASAPTGSAASPESPSSAPLPSPAAKHSPSQSPAQKSFDPSAMVPGSRSEDFVARGVLTPTVYYQPVFNEDRDACKAGEKVNLRDRNNKILAIVCPKTKAACDLQGSCMVQQNGKLTAYNYVDRGAKGYLHFMVVDRDVCPFGLGVSKSCLDPFYNVAADMNYFKAGDVIFVPALMGMGLPNGSKHSGFLIVRDRGGNIDGAGRFDFFSGFYDWRDARNPFSQLKLTDKATKIPYYQVRGETALKVKMERNYPGLPGHKSTFDFLAAK